MTTDHLWIALSWGALVAVMALAAVLRLMGAI